MNEKNTTQKIMDEFLYPVNVNPPESARERFVRKKQAKTGVVHTDLAAWKACSWYSVKALLLECVESWEYKGPVHSSVMWSNARSMMMQINCQVIYFAGKPLILGTYNK